MFTRSKSTLIYDVIQIPPVNIEEDVDFMLRLVIPALEQIPTIRLNSFEKETPRKVFEITQQDSSIGGGEITTLTKLTGENQLIILGNFTSKSTLSLAKFTIKIKAISPRINNNPDADFSTQTLSRTLIINPQSKKSEVESARSQGKGISEVNSASGTAIMGISISLGLLGGDGGGILIRSNQYLEYVSRLRLINIYYGDRLESFLSGMGNAREFKALTSEQRDHIILRQNGDKAKFNKYFIKISFSGRLLLKTGIFLLSWTMKLLSFVFLYFMKQRNKLSTFLVYFIFYQRKVHFLVVGFTMIDIFMYGCRFILHSNAEMMADQIVMVAVIVLTLVLMVIDFSRIAELSGWAEAIFKMRKLGDKKGQAGGISKVHVKKEVLPSSERLEQSARSKMSEAMPFRPGTRQKKFTLRPSYKNFKNKVKLKNKKTIKIIKKKINQAKTLKNLQNNETLEDFLISGITNDSLVFGSKFCILNNYFFMLKLAIGLVVLNGLHHLPLLQIMLILGVELLDLFNGIYNYTTKRYLISFANFLSKTFGGTLMSIFMVICLYIRLTVGSDALIVDAWVQDAGILVVKAGVFSEYLFTILRSFLLAKEWLMNYSARKRLEAAEIKNEIETNNRRIGEVFKVEEKDGPFYYNIEKMVVPEKTFLGSIGDTKGLNDDRNIESMESQPRLSSFGINIY